MDSSAGRRRIGLLGGIGGGNTGNEVSYAVVRAVLAEKLDGARFAIITPMPEGALHTIADPGDLVLPMRAPRPGSGRRPLTVARRVLAELRHVGSTAQAVGGLRAVVVCGTGILDDFEEPWWGMPWSLALWAVSARARRRPFALVAVGAGPIDGRVSRVLHRMTVRLATSVTYRDADSLRTMARIGAERADARVTCDLAFGYGGRPGRPAEPGERMCVGLGVMDWTGWQGADRAGHERYVGVLCETATALLADGHRVLLLTGQPPVDGPVAAEVRQRVRDRVPGGAIEIARCGTFGELCTSIDATDIVVAARFHAIVAALVRGRPVVSMGYAPKNRELLLAAGLTDADRMIAAVTASWVLERITRIVRDPPHADPTTIAGWRELTRVELGRLARELADPVPQVRLPGPTTPRPSPLRRTTGSPSPRGGSRSASP